MTSNSLINDYIAGAIGGSSGLIIGHPFDTIKTQVQIREGSNACRSSLKALRYTYSHGVATGLFRGMSFPLASYGVVNSVFFGVYGNCLSYLNETSGESYRNYYVAGCVGGITQLAISCPVEVVKILLQSKLDKGNLHFRGPSECIRYIIRNHGWRSLYRGVGVSAVRDVPAFGVYMLVYEMTMDRLTTANRGTGRVDSSPSTEAVVLNSLMAGGIAGLCSWTLALPADVVKTRLQCRTLMANKSDRCGSSTAVRCALRVYAESGWRGFFTGWTVVVLRSVPVNAVTLAIYSYCLRVMNDPS